MKWKCPRLRVVIYPSSYSPNPYERGILIARVQQGQQFGRNLLQGRSLYSHQDAQQIAQSQIYRELAAAGVESFPELTFVALDSPIKMKGKYR